MLDHCGTFCLQKFRTLRHIAPHYATLRLFELNLQIAYSRGKGEGPSNENILEIFQ